MKLKEKGVMNNEQIDECYKILHRKIVNDISRITKNVKDVLDEQIFESIYLSSQCRKAESVIISRDPESDCEWSVVDIEILLPAWVNVPKI
jgi:hypothetical protein